MALVPFDDVLLPVTQQSRQYLPASVESVATGGRFRGISHCGLSRAAQPGRPVVGTRSRQACMMMPSASLSAAAAAGRRPIGNYPFS